MKNKIGKIIEVILLVAGILATVAVVVAIPLKSYNEYADYLAWIAEINKPEPKPVLESISVELKEGVKYFKNDLAEPKASDFVVTANYTLEGAPYSEVIEEGKYSVSTKNDFYSKGGEITVTYKNQTTVFEIELIPVKLESISIVQNPHRVRYQTGSTFDAEGMVLSATYNDGSTKLIPADKYVVDTKALTPADTSVAISYTEGGETKNVAVSVTVSDVLDDGAVISLVLTGDAIVQAGEKLSTTAMAISAIYESGNRKQLGAEEYTVSGGDTVAKFGKAYHVSVSYNENPAITLSAPVIVRSTLQGEKGVVVGGKTNTETEYAVVDGVIQNLGISVSFAGNFTKPIQNGQEGSLAFNLNSESAVIGNITMRCGNSYCCYANGKDAADGYIMQPLQINTILDLTVNGKEVAIPDSVVLKGSGPHKDYAPLFGIYYEFTFEGIALEAGANVIKFTFKNSTTNAANLWGESPSTLNIDYVNFDTVGSEIPENYTIESIEISPNFEMKHNQITTNMKPAVVATLTNGTKILTPAELLDIKITGGKAGESRVVYGKYTITATLKSNPAITTSKDYEVCGTRVLKAGLELIDGRVYYVFSGNTYGYAAEDYVFFNESTIYDLIIEFNETEFTFKIDVTDLTVGTVIYPHLRIQGVPYNNGSNNNGDILGQGLTFKDGLTITHNGKIYKIERMYSMPNLHIYAEETN
jgi:hypothetical protein